MVVRFFVISHPAFTGVPHCWLSRLQALMSRQARYALFQWINRFYENQSLIIATNKQMVRFRSQKIGFGQRSGSPIWAFWFLTPRDRRLALQGRVSLAIGVG